MAFITMKRGVQQVHGRLHKDSDIVYYVTKSGKQCYRVMPKRKIPEDKIPDGQRKQMSRFKEASLWARDVMNRVDGQEQYDELYAEFSKQRKYVIFRNFLIAKYLKC